MTVIDVRTTEEFSEGHLPGSINIPLIEFLARLDEVPRDEKVVLVCKSGNRSGQAHAFCVAAGYTNVFNGKAWDNIQEAEND